MNTSETAAKVLLEAGDSVSFTKTISESNVYMLADITLDFSQMHTNEELMKTTPYKRLLVHGVLTFALGSTASALIQVQAHATIPSLYYGYDWLRFLKLVYFGDSMTANCRVDSVDDHEMKSFATIEIFNLHDQLCVVAKHILKFLPIWAFLIWKPSVD
ncbi:MaoC/PaaZ C-terminal domain-containing protein [Acidithrix ferrooxidans]|uniref:(R)-specific enoyl-CoA hydratase n=1 Tax=Acidithrix ferrooxidans TaxID=1280514 RepID=A0A0D8HIW4_9ACTN|nr:MaoC/PaaZ C-terminal domain-containing protein [Acidithrix ferrooxidans]KJF17021.1 (R)-specific enoyl-CoA hydratase [Acidithrix ferrooxidans]